MPVAFVHQPVASKTLVDFFQTPVPSDVLTAAKSGFCFSTVREMVFSPIHWCPRFEKASLP